MSGLEYEFRAEYLELADTMEEYAADLLGQARDSKEVRKLVCHNKWQSRGILNVVNLKE